MKIDGACSCGNIRIEGEADPDSVSVCHWPGLLRVRRAKTSRPASSFSSILRLMLWADSRRASKRNCSTLRPAKGKKPP